MVYGAGVHALWGPPSARVAGRSGGLLFDREQGFRRDPDDGKPSTREQLAELRAADPGITQAAAAAAIGVTERTIRSYWSEAGEASNVVQLGSSAEDTTGR
jgi:hypothetical protein